MMEQLIYNTAEVKITLQISLQSLSSLLHLRTFASYSEFVHSLNKQTNLLNCYCEFSLREGMLVLLNRSLLE